MPWCFGFQAVKAQPEADSFGGELLPRECALLGK